MCTYVYTYVYLYVFHYENYLDLHTHSNCHDLTLTRRVMFFWRLYLLFQYNSEIFLLSGLAGNGMVFQTLSLTVVFLSTLKLREKDWIPLSWKRQLGPKTRNGHLRTSLYFWSIQLLLEMILLSNISKEQWKKITLWFLF